MGAAAFKVVITEPAIADLNGIDDYWTERGEPERGAKYFEDLMRVAECELIHRDRAKRGRVIENAPLPETREILVFKSSYRVIYRIAEDDGTVFVLRFWHSHRDEPFE